MTIKSKGHRLRPVGHDKQFSIMKKNDRVKLNITDMGVNGEGIGKADDLTLFVKGGVIGDEVDAVVTKMNKGYGFAKALEILKPSPYRVVPACPEARRCGGCQIMELSYERQLEFKYNKVRNNLERIGGFSEEVLDKVMKPVVGMENPLHYRNKAQYPVGTDKEGKLVAGFYAGRTHQIIPNRECALGVEENKKILDAILGYMEENHVSAYNEETGKGLVRHILIRCGFDSGEVLVCLVINGNRLPAENKLVSKLTGLDLLAKERQAKGNLAKGNQAKENQAEENQAEENQDSSENEAANYSGPFKIKSISLNINTKKTNVILGTETRLLWGEPFITDKIGDISFQISPQSFYQVNPKQTEKMYSLALKYADLHGEETVWDLYCGIGTISLFLSQKAKQVYGVEIVPEAIEDAKQNAKINGIKNAEFFVGKSEEILPEFYEKIKREKFGSNEKLKDMAHPDVIVVDPPRKGCDAKLLETILKMEPERVVYVSCDSATLARDLKILCAEKYSLREVTPVDNFCQTVHVETCVLLTISETGNL